MKAKITAEFTALRPGDKKNSTVHAGEIVDGELARWAVSNGHGKQVSEDTSTGKPEAKAAPAPAKASDKKAGKAKAEKDGASGDGAGGQGEGEDQ